MKPSKADLRQTTYGLPDLRFEDQDLTSFSGLIFFQALFNSLRIKEKLQACVRHLKSSSTYGPSRLLLVLLVHLILGWRRLRDLDYYRDDPLVLRVVGLRQLPDVSTMSRFLTKLDSITVDRYRDQIRDFVLDRVKVFGSKLVTLDFDGTIQTTKSRGTEGTAVGFNPKSKGQRSYYPICATIAQTGQVLDIYHRPGNCHDSKGALAFIQACFSKVRESGVRGRLEARLDSAHFSDATCFWLADNGIEFSISVPFERFVELKTKVESKPRWKKIDQNWSYIEARWLPRSWRGRAEKKEIESRKFRVILFRQSVKTPLKGPIQLELFRPVDRHFEYKAVITNKNLTAKALLSFHNGRGSQEGIFGELKSQLQMDYIPTRRLAANQIYTLTTIFAHNLNREMQLRLNQPKQRNSFKRGCLWVVEKIGTFRRRVIQRAGRINRPNGKLTLTLSANSDLENEFRSIYLKLCNAA